MSACSASIKKSSTIYYITVFKHAFCVLEGMRLNSPSSFFWFTETFFCGLSLIDSYNEILSHSYITFESYFKNILKSIVLCSIQDKIELLRNAGAKFIENIYITQHRRLRYTWQLPALVNGSSLITRVIHINTYIWRKRSQQVIFYLLGYSHDILSREKYWHRYVSYPST